MREIFFTEAHRIKNFFMVWFPVFIGILLIFGIKISTLEFLYFLFAGLFLLFFMICFKVMLLHFSAEVLGEKGSVLGLLSLFLDNLMPLHLLLPLTLILKNAPIVYFFLGLLCLWIVKLNFNAICTNYQVPAKKALLILLVPSISFFFFLTVLITFFIKIAA